VRQRELTEAQVLVLWARLASLSSARGERYVVQAYAAAPDDPEVQFWLGRLELLKGQRSAAERLFRAALAHDPDNAGYELGLVALYAAQTMDREWQVGKGGDALMGAVDRLGAIARTPAELDTVAIYHLLDGRPELAKTFATRACESGPDCWECFHTQAEASSRTGDTATAVTLELAAIDRLPEEVSDKIDLALRNALHKYQAAAATPSVPAPTAVDLFLPW